MNSMEDRTTDPGIIKLKLKEEIRNLRDARRADRIEFMEESQRQTRSYNELAAAHNELVEIADRESKKSILLGALLSAAVANCSLLTLTAWIDGELPLRVLVMSALLSACVGAIHHTVATASLWDEDAE